MTKVSTLYLTTTLLIFLNVAVCKADTKRLVCSGTYDDWQSGTLQKGSSDAVILIKDDLVTVERAHQFNGIYRKTELSDDMNVIFSDGKVDGFQGRINRYSASFEFVNSPILGRVCPISLAGSAEHNYFELT